MGKEADMDANVIVFAERQGERRQSEATRICLSAAQCFPVDDEAQERRAALALAEHLATLGRIGVYIGDDLTAVLLRHAPTLREKIAAIILEPGSVAPEAVAGIPVFSPDQAPDDLDAVLLAHRLAQPRWAMRSRLPTVAATAAVEPTVIGATAPEAVPAHAWSVPENCIYPIDLPDVKIRPNLDLLLLDCPARNLAMLPNGLGYVHNALKKSTVEYQTFDLDIVAYHRYHINRIFDRGGKVVLESGREMPLDPWQAEHYDIWAQADVIDHFLPELTEIAAAVLEAKPKILGLSIQQCNEHFCRRLVNYLRTAMPDLIVLIGGFSCYNAEIGRRAFPECDYMCVGEADLSVGPLVEALARGERPSNMPGVLSRFDDPAIPFMPAPMHHNLDVLDFPRYEWFGIDIYRNYNGYRLTPIIASRGCRWARCTFCAERFYWRIRTADNFVDEVEWLANQGCRLLMYNESDLNGQPERLLEICDEVIRRNLNVRFTGQLRVHKACDRAYFDKLRASGVVSLRFGIDAFSENTLRLQKKGYTKEMVTNVLKACWEAGIYTEVNWVIGVPGETEADVDEGIEFIIENQQYIGRLANINPLILANGSVYWIDPEAHKIKFRAPTEQLFQLYSRAIPAHLWYSEAPYIDATVRKERFERIVCALHEKGFPVGAWAERIIQDVLQNRDANRSNAGERRNTDNTVNLQAPEAVYKRDFGNHRIYRYAGYSYAVPMGMDDVGFFGSGQVPEGVLRDLSEDALLATIEEAQGWADLRGQYDPRVQQRRRGSLMQANAALNDAPPAPVNAVSFSGGEIITPFDYAFLVVDPQTPVGEWLAGPRSGPDAARILGAHSKAFSVEFIQIYLERYKVLLFAGRYFGVPVTVERMQIEMIDEPERWDIVIDRKLDGVRAKIRAKLAESGDLTVAVAEGRSDVSGESKLSWPMRAMGPAEASLAVPTTISHLHGYRIVSYEGVIYGLPADVADVDLREMDVMELPGVIRDVSRTVVEEEIRALFRAPAMSDA
jgi:radical SAM superfamily enzyme YgiQ (UPF0313 family)